ncbi:hypothetical protein [Marinoscillum sp. MHG1-6]|uniref:hypothetical protein n=1 Tax=Marinoscillum sp. MHG1-6 TaxID=2959627 RepID=UPI002157CEF7|nr:hypothetical protein [Marinoscillum sp. MHG1-6]
MAYKKDLDLEIKWQKLLRLLEELLDKKPKDLNAVLFLIGVQELGKGIRNFSKEEKQDLMHIATCKILSYSGFYELEGLDEEGWPHWKKSNNIPSLSLMDQEKLIKMNAIEYFERELQLNV